MSSWGVEFPLKVNSVQRDLMSETDQELSKVLVAQFLKKHGYLDSLASYLKESGVSLRAANESIYEDLESIVKDRIRFNEHAIAEQMKTTSLNSDLDLVNIEKYGIPAWNHKLSWDEVIGSYSKTRSLIIKTRFLTNGVIGNSTVGKEFIVSGIKEEDSVTIMHSMKKSGIVKYFGSISDSLYYTGTIDGKVTVSKINEECSWSFDLPVRALLALELIKLGNDKILCFYCTMNNTLNVHLFDLSTSSLTKIDEFKLLSACTTFQLAISSDGCPIIFLTRQDFTQVMILKFQNGKIKHVSNIALNTAQFSTHSFNISDMVILSFDSTEGNTNLGVKKITPSSVLAVATSHTPYMRIIVTKIPSLDTKGPDSTSQLKTQPVSEELNILDDYSSKDVVIPSMARQPDIITHYDMILINIATDIPQDSYTQPILKVSYPLGGLIVGADAGLYAVDLQKSETWQLTYRTGQRVKSMDCYKDFISVSFADREWVIWKLK